MHTYNKEKLTESFDIIHALVNMQPGDSPWTIYAQEVTRKFNKLKDLLALTQGNLTDWWQLMLWQHGLPLIPNVQNKSRKAGYKLIEKKLNLEEWHNIMAQIIQRHYELTKTAPPSVGQAFAARSATGCPCCGSEEIAAQEAADAAPSLTDISKMTAKEISEAYALTAQQHGVEAVRSCDACGQTGHISANCPNGCRFCKVKPDRGTGSIRHHFTCPMHWQGSRVAAVRAGA